MEAQTIPTTRFERAQDFVWKNARLIDRLRFSYLFCGAAKQPVFTALLPYQNADGGFGNALEPDLRGPNSQPVPVWSAFCILDEIADFSSPLVDRALDYLLGMTTEDGGVPFVLPDAKDYPHAFWWETDENPSASLNPTAGIAGFLHKYGRHHVWLQPATDFCWGVIEAAQETSPYELVCILSFLQFVPERDRAELAFEKVRQFVRSADFIAYDPKAEGVVHFPLDFAPVPSSLGRRLFADEIIESHLDALIESQSEDGGWDVNFQIWTPITGIEWRAIRTIEVLKCLAAYGRLPALM